jgi:23S rRNA (guanine745-N1)-methyltransferase
VTEPFIYPPVPSRKQSIEQTPIDQTPIEQPPAEETVTMYDSAFKCPSCHNRLQTATAEGAKSYRCSNNHNFDMAKEGYLNLLLAQHKRSRNPGDSDEMIRSRQRFLNGGHYQLLADAIVKQVHLEANDQRVLDMGCGEGYYIDQLRQASGTMQLIGIDISKTAVRLAAKRKINALLAVDSAFSMPLHSDSIDCAISVFSPVSAKETARVLVPGGSLIMVGPGEEHLSGLTDHIYSNKVPHQGNNLDDNLGDFILQETLEVRDSITITGPDILDLLKMTPYYWHARAEQQEGISKLQILETDIHFMIKIYKIKFKR